MVTTFDPGRMIWNGYTGAAGWMFRQAIEGVLGYRLVDGAVVPPPTPRPPPTWARPGSTGTSPPAPCPAGPERGIAGRWPTSEPPTSTGEPRA